MNNSRTIAALEKTIAQLTTIKDRLVAADEKSDLTAAPAKKTAAKKTVAKKTSATKAPAKKRAAKKTA